MSLVYKETERQKLLKKDYFLSGCMDFLKKRYNGIRGNEWTRTQYVDITTILEGDMDAFGFSDIV